MSTNLAITDGSTTEVGRPDWAAPFAVLVVFVGGGLIFLCGVWGAAATVAAVIVAAAVRVEGPRVTRRWSARRETRRADRAARRDGGG